MPIKTILVYLNRRHGCEQVLDAACALARNHGAHLMGMAAFSALPPVPPLAIPYPTTVIDEMMRAAGDAEQELRQVFEDVTRDAPFVAEWVSVRTSAGDLVTAVLEHARAADLIVANQRDPDWDLGPVLDFPERLAMESGRPVFLVPREGCPSLQFNKIAIAWNGTSRAARAAFDAFPFYQSAREVAIFTVTADGEPLETGTPAQSIAATLARHDVNTTLKYIKTGSGGISKTLLKHVGDFSADLLVMGAYGHSRFSEFVFGGVTRDLTNESPLPLLISH
ncbi:MAG: universal stress protein [Alphaproteobacteria bacterium]|nr:universal stress protein [Alphaproteobacteria bacterium]